MQSLWTRLFDLVKCHLSLVAQWIVKLLVLIPWKCAHSWRQGSEFTRAHGLVWSVIRKFHWAVAFWRNTYCPFVAQLALDIHCAYHPSTVWEWGILPWKWWGTQTSIALEISGATGLKLSVADSLCRRWSGGNVECLLRFSELTVFDFQLWRHLKDAVCRTVQN